MHTGCREGTKFKHYKDILDIKHMLNFRLLNLLSFIFLLPSCSSNNSTFVALAPPIDNESIIYIYRPASLSNVVISPMLKINGEGIIEISNNSYSYFHLPAGSNTFKLELSQRYIGKKELQLDIKPQQTYFIKISTSLKFEKNKPYTRRFDITTSQKNIALEEIKDIPYAGKNKIVSATKSTFPTEKTEDSQFTIDKTRNPFSK